VEESAAEATDRRAVEAWFRHRGLPYVVRRKLGAGGLLPRTTPAFVVLLALDPLLSKYGELNAANHADFSQRADNPAYVAIEFILLIAAMVAPILLGRLVAGWLRRLSRTGKLVVAFAILLLTVAVVPAIEQWAGLHDGLNQYLLTNVLPVPILLLLVFLGAGSIISWALRNGIYQLRRIGTLASRALPLLMLVMLFSFFATEVWQVADALNRAQLWLVVGFLAALAVLFLTGVLSDELRGMVGTLRAVSARELVAHVRNTPLAALIDENHEKRARPLSGLERLNITLVLFFAQALQILVFSLLVFGLFMVFGAIAVKQSVVKIWLGTDPKPGVLLGVHLPVSNALVQVSLFLAVFSGLYFAASVATDEHYRKSFFEPLLADVRVSLAAREVYLARWPTQG
jgi:hypothetical protein